MRFRGFMNHVLRCSCIGILYERSILRKFNFPHAGSESLISHMLERRRRPRLSMQKETTHTLCESGRNEQKKVLNAATANRWAPELCVCVSSKSELGRLHWSRYTVHQSIWQSSLRGQYYNRRIRWAWFGSVVFLFFLSRRNVCSWLLLPIWTAQ